MYLTSHTHTEIYAEVERLLEQFKAASARRCDAEVECARTLARLAELDAWSFAGCVSVGEFGERHAIPAA